MKQQLKEAFSWKTLEPFVLGVGIIMVLEFIIFPSLTVADTILNLLGVALTAGLVIFTITYIKTKLWQTGTNDGTKNNKSLNANKKKKNNNNGN